MKRRYQFYRFMYSARQWYTHRVSAAGKMVLITLVFTGLFGVDTRQNLSHQIFCFTTALFLFSFSASTLLKGSLKKLTVVRQLPSTGSVGMPVIYTVAVNNSGKKRIKGVIISEQLQDPRPSFEVFTHLKEPGEAHRNAYDRYVAFYRWKWLLRRGTMAQTSPSKAMEVPPRSHLTHRMTLLPVKRGRLKLEGVHFLRSDPTGLCTSHHKIDLSDSILIYPKIYKVAPIALPGTRQFQPGGVALASAIGEAEEFISLREYRPGDPLRSIHWKSWAKTGKPIVKEFQEEFFVRHALVLDTFYSGPGDVFWLSDNFRGCNSSAVNG